MRLKQIIQSAVVIFVGVTLASARVPSRNSTEEQLNKAEALLAEEDRAGADEILLPLLKELQASTAKSDSSADDWYLLGRIHYIMQRDVESMRAFDKAIELNPNDGFAFYWRGVLKHYGENPKLALDDFRKAAQIEPENTSFLYALAADLESQKLFDEAIAVYSNLKSLEPGKSAPLTGMVGILIEQHKLDEALEIALEAAKLEPRNVIAISNLGQLYQRMNKPAEAVAQYKLVVELEPGRWRNHAKLIQLYEQLGDVAKRDEARTKLLELAGRQKPDQAIFCREQRKVGKIDVMFFEFFDQTGDEEGNLVIYSALQLDETGKATSRIRLESLQATTEISRELGRIKADERHWTIDGYVDDGHITWAHLAGHKPTYEEFRDQVVAIVEGKVTPVSRSKKSDEGVDVQINPE